MRAYALITEIGSNEPKKNMDPLGYASTPEGVFKNQAREKYKHTSQKAQNGLCLTKNVLSVVPVAWSAKKPIQLILKLFGDRLDSRSEVGFRSNSW